MHFRGQGQSEVKHMPVKMDISTFNYLSNEVSFLLFFNFQYLQKCDELKLNSGQDDSKKNMDFLSFFQTHY